MNLSPADSGREAADLALGPRFVTEILDPLKAVFVAKDEIIDLLGVCLVGGENLFILGPPGTAKSALVHELAARLGGDSFEYLLTRFTEPNEIFGPFDIRRLREGELVTNTEGMLPEASLVFLDELLNANSAILNSLLTVLNERVFRRGREHRKLPTLAVVGASNRLPEDDALGALFDRFLLRAHCDNVGDEQLPQVLDAGWRLDVERPAESGSFGVEEVRELETRLRDVNFAGTRESYVTLVRRLRTVGISISDRRAVKLQRVIAASALLCGRHEVQVSDLWVLRHIWDREEQREVIAALVDESLGGSPEEPGAHPRSRREDGADPEVLARDLEQIERRIAEPRVASEERSFLRDQLGVLAGRCQWVGDDAQRDFLLGRVERLWGRFEESA